MHGAALAAGYPARLAVNFRDHAGKIAALCQIGGMRTMARHDRILRTQGGTNADRHRLLPDAQMHGTAHLLFAVTGGDGLLDPADAPHGPVQGRQIGGGEG